MARPHPALIDLAAGRPMPSRINDPGHLLVSAVDHRMQGLLWSAVVRGEIELPLDIERHLATLDLRTQAHHRKLWTALEEITGILGGHGIEVATFKGITAEARWHDRTGERPSRDIDLWVDPGPGPNAMQDALAALSPHHVLDGHIAKLAGPGTLQSVDVGVAGVDVDLHWDPLKLGANIDLQRFWDDSTEVLGFKTGQYRVLTLDGELVSVLLHATRDRFAMLSTISEASRLLGRAHLVDRLGVELGLDRLVRNAALTVGRILEMDHPNGLATVSEADTSWKNRLWHRYWDEPLLGGSNSLVSKGKREMFLFACADGLMAKGMSRLVKRAFAPPSLLRYHFNNDEFLTVIWLRRLGLIGPPVSSRMAPQQVSDASETSRAQR